MLPQIVQGSVVLSNKFRFRAGDILYGKLRPNLNKVALARAAGICSTDIWVLRPEPEILPDFALGFLTSTWFVNQVLAFTKGDLPRADANDFDTIPLPLPVVSEQHRIVDVLREMENIRRHKAQATYIAAELVPSLFHRMFGSTTSHDVRQLATVADVASGVAKGRNINTAAVREVPYLRVANVQDGYLDLSEIKTVPATEDEISALRLQSGDVVMTEGGDEDKLGRGAIWRGEIPECIHQNHVFRVRPSERLLDGVWFSWFLRTQEARTYFLRAAKRTTNLASINMSQLRALPVPVPSFADQLRFRALAEELEHTPSLQNDAALTSELHAAIHANAFSGRLTANWRDSHASILASESADRDAALTSRGVKPITVGVAALETDEDVPSIWSTPDDGGWTDLSKRQRALWRYIPAKSAPFGVEDLLHTRDKETLLADLSEDGFRRELEVLVTRGLLLHVSRFQEADSGGSGDEFRHYYRKVSLPERAPTWNAPAVRALAAHLREQLTS